MVRIFQISHSASTASETDPALDGNHLHLLHVLQSFTVSQSAHFSHFLALSQLLPQLSAVTVSAD
jgi:hypothetical protein